MPMSFVSVCPHCLAKLKLKNPDLVGKQARCPACQERFVVKKAAAASPPIKPAAASPNPAPEPDPHEEDPWLNDDLDSFGEEAEQSRPSPGQGAALPPSVTGVNKKRKPSAADGGSQRASSSSAVGLDQVAWIGWIVGGGIAGLIGASVWGAIGAWTWSEWGILAWAIGGLVGFGVRVGAREGDVGLLPGLTALGIALASVVLGKFLIIHFLTARMEDMLADLGNDGEQVEITEEEAIDWVIADYAIDIEYEWEEEGRKINTPDYETIPEDAPSSAYHDPEVWAAAEQQWNEMSEEDQAEEILSYQSGEFDLDLMEGEMFAASFGLLDILWFFLAAVTAFRVGSGLDFGDE